MIIAFIIFAVCIVLTQLIAVVHAVRNTKYAFSKYRPRPSAYQPYAAVIVPCKGIDTTFDRNIEALFTMDYPRYELFFVVESQQDPAHGRLGNLIRQNPHIQSHLIIAGISSQRVQKVHNLLAVIDKLPSHIEALAFVDSDACPKPHFLTSLIHPLRLDKVGSATGHRWFVPENNALPSIFLSAMNAFMATQLGPHRWNANWGGAMAIRKETFFKADVPRYWQNASTDDYTMTLACKKIGLRVRYVPACFAASYETTTWNNLFHFARRQFLLTRINMPLLWKFAFVGLGQFLLGFWASVLFAILFTRRESPMALYAAGLAAGVWQLAALKAIARQCFIALVLPDDRHKLIVPALLDIFLSPVVHLVTFACLTASACSKTVVWRGIRYTFHSIDRTEITRLN